jgi:hypothetical protein
MPWPFPEIAANNSILARFLSGAIAADETAVLYSRLATASVEAGDRILVQNNHAVVLIRSGRLSEAASILGSIHGVLLASREPDGYHQYFVANNLAGLAAISGDVTRARELLLECGKVIDQFYPAIHATMARRHQLIMQALEQAPTLTAEAWDAFLIERYGMQVGPQWTFYGRGFLLTDIQFWSD